MSPEPPRSKGMYLGTTVLHTVEGRDATHRHIQLRRRQEARERDAPAATPATTTGMLRRSEALEYSGSQKSRIDEKAFFRRSREGNPW